MLKSEREGEMRVRYVFGNTNLIDESFECGF